MRKTHVRLGNRSYHILIGSEIIRKTGEFLESLVDLGMRCALVTNAAIYKRYGKDLKTSLTRAGRTVHVITIPQGERYKSLATAKTIYEQLYTRGFGRDAFVVSLGGGVIGDIAGFIAATYMRGIPYIQIPTTLLSQVDSSVGGKVAVNLPKGKNMVGAFYQPRMVIADSRVLSSLPKRELKSGLAEVIKYGVIRDRNLFEYLERRIEDVCTLQPEPLEKIICSSCKIKADVIEIDEREYGIRAILNYGHTIGHALESLSHYVQFLHGEAVALGMVAASLISHKIGTLPYDEALRQRQLLERAGLPTRLKTGVRTDSIIKALRGDKKVRKGKVRFVLAERIGKVYITDKVGERVVKEALREMRK